MELIPKYLNLLILVQVPKLLFFLEMIQILKIIYDKPVKLQLAANAFKNPTFYLYWAN